VGLDWLGIGDQFGGFSLGIPGNPGTGNPRGFVDAPVWGLLYKYVTQNERIIKCPSDNPGPWAPNEVVSLGNGKFSYTMNSILGLRPPERIPANSAVRGTTRNPSLAPLFVEEHGDGINNDHREGNFGAFGNQSVQGGDKLVSRHGPFIPRQGVRPSDGVHYFPQGSTNIGFADGHSESIQTSFGYGQNEQQTVPGIIANNLCGLMYYYGIKFDVLPFQ